MGMVLVIPEIALWAFAVLSLLMVYITSVKVSDIWNEIDRSQPWQNKNVTPEKSQIPI